MIKLKLTLLLFVLVLAGCQSPKQIQPPPRPTSPASVCMEDVISTIKKSRLAFNNSASNWLKCMGSRQLMERAGISVKNLGPCPNDIGPMAYDSYKSHAFALETINTNACPANFQSNFSEYKKTWGSLRDLAAPYPTMPLSEFHNVMTKGVPSNSFEFEILHQQKIISRVQPLLWIIYQRETGWCHDNSDTKDIIYWRGCPSYR
jgi:hypothetical protein